LLIVAILALFAGPALYHWLRQGGRIARVVDTVIVAVLVLLVGLLLVPESLAALGYPALALIGAGYLVPGLLELAIRRAAHAFHQFSLLLALVGLLLHAMLDGAGLASGTLHASSTLGIAIVLHRFGMGLVIWLIVQPGYGRRAAAGVLAAMAVATVVGYLLSERFLALQGQGMVVMVQALIIGTIVHSLVHRGHAAQQHAGH
jgi:hypothetical protein